MNRSPTKKRKRLRIILCAPGVLCALMLGLMLTGHFNPIFARLYSVQGVDVSHYQGEIDFAALKENGIDFAYIKATEGSGHVDEQFAQNRKAAEEAGMLYGAYHFFSFDSEPAAQAALFMQTVGGMSGQLVPVLDVEYYADKRVNPPEKETLIPKIREMLSFMETACQSKPMLYTTYPFYEAYLKGAFEDYPLWIRNTYFPPLDKGSRWSFWQYTDHAKLPGCYEGAEPYIDRNVFRGSEAELSAFLVP